MAFSLSRTYTLCHKETLQIIRDPSCLLIAVVIPLMLLFIFGYGINLDSNRLKVGVLVEQQSQAANNFVQSLNGSTYIQIVPENSRQALTQKINSGEIRGIVVIPNDFAQRLNENKATIQVITDGSEPNTAKFVQGYLNGVWQIWQQQQLVDKGLVTPQTIQIETRYWFNADVISQHYIVPGSITIIMTVIGSILTSLVVAREWERGTMESLLSTPITKWELLLSKLLPYYILGIIALIICLLVAIFIMQIPFRGSLFYLFIISSLFLLTILAMGLLISTLMRNQFNAAMIAINAAFLPAIMLSGFVFEIDSMPAIVRMITYLIPARYYVNAIQTLFLAGDIISILLVNAGFLLSFMVILLLITIKKTKLNLD
ncbi:ABC transporter permease [Orbus mooreae]|uniref:ABC transporter permease n=1 Tax=Orbus mooreae TaxID=3074107 RepID=UPI00370D2B69